jgi:hypothetical protein
MSLTGKDAKGGGGRPLVSQEAQAALRKTPELDYLTHIVMRLYENKQCVLIGITGILRTLACLCPATRRGVVPCACATCIDCQWAHSSDAAFDR